MKNRTEVEWRQLIDGEKTAVQIAKEAGVSVSTVYFAARRFQLKIKDPRDQQTEYRGIPIDTLIQELETSPISAVAYKHNISVSSLRGYFIRRNVKFYQTRQRYVTAQQPQNMRVKRTGEALDMIRELIKTFADSSIARVFGYSKERIRQIRNEENAKKQNTN